LQVSQLIRLVPRVSPFYTSSLHDALPIYADAVQAAGHLVGVLVELAAGVQHRERQLDSGQSLGRMDVHRDAAAVVGHRDRIVAVDRKSTRLNSSHVKISYAVFCLNKKKHT